MKKRHIILLLIIGLIITYEIIFRYNPEIELNDVKLDKNITTVEDAIKIAEQYSLNWDKRAVVGEILIQYLNKDDLINNLPSFVIYSGWNSGFLSDGWTIIKVSGDTLVEFRTYQSGTLNYIRPLPKIERYPTNQDIIDLLDKITSEKKINWRDYDNVAVIITPYPNNELFLRLILDDSWFEFLYQNSEIIITDSSGNSEETHRNDSFMQ